MRTAHCPAQEQDALLAAVQKRLGVRLPRSLEPRLVERAEGLVARGVARSLSALAGHLLEAADRDPVVEALRETASIQETYFFRAPRQLERLGELLREERQPLFGEGPLRMLSVGCATGEEAYSLAMLAERALPGVRCEVVGLDMNPAALERARRAEYGPRSVRAAAPPALALDEIPGGWRVRPGVRDRVRFVTGNIVTDSLLAAVGGGFQGVVLRNVLIYAGPADVPRALQQLLALAAPRALFVTGPVESASAKAHLPGFAARGHGVWARLPGAPAGAAATPPAAPTPREDRRRPAPQAPTRPAGQGAGSAETRQGAPDGAPARAQAADRGDRAGAGSGSAGTRQGAPDGALARAQAADRGDWAGAGAASAGPRQGAPDGALGRARAAADRGDWAGAVAAAQAAVDEAPDAPGPRWLRGTIELGRGEARAAVRHFEAALFLERSFLPALLGLAQALELAGEPQRARRQYARLLEAAGALPPEASVAPLDLSAAAVLRLARMALAGGER